MSNEDKKRPTLTVHEGGRKLGEPFDSSASLTPVPKLPNTKELKCFTTNEIMRDMLDAFQEAHELNFNALGILLQDNTLGGLQYAPVNDEGELIEYVSKPKLTNVENLKPEGLELVAIFDLSEPFIDQFPKKYIKSVRGIDDILKAFIDIAEQHKHDNGGYGELDITPQQPREP